MKKPPIKLEASFVIDDMIQVTLDHIGVTIREGEQQVSLEWQHFETLGENAAAFLQAMADINGWEKGEELIDE